MEFNTILLEEQVAPVTLLVEQHVERRANGLSNNRSSKSSVLNNTRAETKPIKYALSLKRYFSDSEWSHESFFRRASEAQIQMG